MSPYRTFLIILFIILTLSSVHAFNIVGKNRTFSNTKKDGNVVYFLLFSVNISVSRQFFSCHDVAYYASRDSKRDFRICF